MHIISLFQRYLYAPIECVFVKFSQGLIYIISIIFAGCLGQVLASHPEKVPMNIIKVSLGELVEEGIFSGLIMYMISDESSDSYLAKYL